uniref:Uncharacterized protein n=1 Tax=Chromera velia CCMP2878 TaxID=1169474 RepID=A0A0G4HUD4_9ALVE|eukprot:Cvel_1370.t1-p1 / transcript=Cvel_1370.t1 / gene=Cvel_1370 / organism=Chromera_velia_CCMP2878 / gene_product=hypothetical protein / transcript_product=hypothetical protein / location=Cvel_scaffold47:107643-109921(-) / protein_length=497 / sequence_SO=supercontig / SO=protein_coding / is_pseudo=false
MQAPEDPSQQAPAASAALPYAGKMQITSGALCYGEPHNIRHGQTRPVQLPSLISPQAGGTVRCHSLEYNIAALNGEWRAYPLKDIGPPPPNPFPENPELFRYNPLVGWFVCHASVDPREECNRILKISGSPYEEDSEESMNSANTFRERVFVINRYDWGYYDQRGMPEEGEESANSAADSFVPNGVAVGLVDKSAAGGGERGGWGDRGVWLECGGEYMFGRFGLTSDRKAAHSFLFFTANTNFTRTSISTEGVEALSIPLTAEERHAKRLASGEYSGMTEMKRMITQGGWTGNLVPAETLTGPFRSQGGELLSSEEVSKFLDVCHEGAKIEPVLMEESVGLLNELMCSMLVGLFSPELNECETWEDLASKMFPNHSKKNSVAGFCHPKILSTSLEEAERPIPFDTQRLCENTAAFLRRHCTGGCSWAEGVASEPKRIVGVMLFVLGEILELSGNCMRDFSRPVMMPVDIRMSICNDNELLLLVKSCRSFWPPSTETA